MVEAIRKTIAVFRTAASSSDEEAYRQLVSQGVEAPVAARLVEFVPMVYCRLLLEKSGVRFPNTFRRKTPSGEISPEREFSSDPVWNEIVSFAQNEIKIGVSPADLLATAGRSADFDAVNQLLRKGAILKDVVLTSPILLWPETVKDGM